MVDEPDTPLEETARLRQEPVPPPMLESRVVAALRADGLIRAGSRAHWLARIAAALLFFAAGAALGHFVLPAPKGSQPGPAQARYLLLLAGDVAPAVDGASRAEEYGAWARSLATRGIAVSGDELRSSAEIVSNGSATTFPDLTSVGGYFLIEASDDATAAALARTCPHIRYGGSIVVRRVH